MNEIKEKREQARARLLEIYLDQVAEESEKILGFIQNKPDDLTIEASIIYPGLFALFSDEVGSITNFLPSADLDPRNYPEVVSACKEVADTLHYLKDESEWAEYSCPGNLTTWPIERRRREMREREKIKKEIDKLYLELTSLRNGMHRTLEKIEKKEKQIKELEWKL